MNESNYRHHGNEGPDTGGAHPNAHDDPRPYWRRAHHDWRVWVGLVFMFAAIAIYVLSDDLRFLPHI